MQRVLVGLVAVLMFTVHAAAQTRPVDDPFSDANRADQKPAPATKPAPVTLPFDDPFTPRDTSKVDGRIDFTLKVTPAEVRRGEIVSLEIIGTPRPGFYTYPLTQRTAQQAEGQLATLQYEKVPGIQPLWPVRETEPTADKIPVLNEIHLKHKKEFTWTQDILVLPDAPPGKKELPFSIRLQVCDESCITGELFFKVEFVVSDAPAVALTPTLQERLKVKGQELKVVAGTTSAHPEASTPGKSASHQTGGKPEGVVKAAIITAPTTAEYRAGLDSLVNELQGQSAVAESDSLFAFVMQGIFWGAVSLITPCVFPMIPITVSFFLKQSESKDYRPITLAVVYSVTIVVVLTISAVALLSVFRWLSVHPLMNFGLGLLFVFFALSLFGMYDIELPSFLSNFTASRERGGGLFGTMFMALTFTIVSFACVAPFLGGFGGTAAGSGMGLTHRILGGFAFAATFAAPFFVLALFPGLLKKMPKSGSWLNSVKVVMGFLELAAALKFFRAGELVLIPMPVFFTYDLVLGMWIALALLCGLYLLNFYRLPHDTPAENITVPRLLFGFCFLSLSFYLLPALFKAGAEGEKQRPTGSVYAWVDSFLLPEQATGKEELVWAADLKSVVEEVRGHAQRTGQQQLIFLDFTGETCTNCKLNEHGVFPRPEIKSLFQSYKLVQLYTDKIPDKYYAPELKARFGNATSRQRADAAANLAFQKTAFDTEQLPLYVILEPRLDGTLAVLGQYTEGKINDESAFVRFLQDGLARNGIAGRTQAKAD